MKDAVSLRGRSIHRFVVPEGSDGGKGPSRSSRPDQLVYEPTRLSLHGLLLRDSKGKRDHSCWDGDTIPGGRYDLIRITKGKAGGEDGPSAMRCRRDFGARDGKRETRLAPAGVRLLACSST